MCCVCRQLVLLCAACDRNNPSKQYHCRAHRSLAGCFYRFLDPFTEEELQRQEVSLANLLEAAELVAPAPQVPEVLEEAVDLHARRRPKRGLELRAEGQLRQAVAVRDDGAVGRRRRFFRTKKTVIFCYLKSIYCTPRSAHRTPATCFPFITPLF